MAYPLAEADRRRNHFVSLACGEWEAIFTDEKT